MSYLYTLLPLVVLDYVWLSLMSGFYRSQLAHLFAPSFAFTPALVFYPLYALAAWFFVVVPALKTDAGLPTVILSGALLGLAAYGAYDLTNQATLKDWPLLITVIDMAWGACVTATACTAAFLLATYVRF